MDAQTMAPPSATRPVLLSVRGIGRRFGGLQAVSELSFDLHEGEILGLIGPNGAGKSTTFNLLSGFLQLSAGEVRFQGAPLQGGAPWKAARSGLVRTFQHGSMLSDLTVRDNIFVGTWQSVKSEAARTQRVLETARILGLENLLDEVAKNLPHGHQRMLGIAIAFASRPRLLCLDEPLTGMNQTEAFDALRMVRRLRDAFGTSILFVEHNMQAVMALCDRIVVLNHGRQLACGTPLEVRNNPAVIEAYLGGA